MTNIQVRNNYIHHNDKAGIVFGGYAESRGRVTASEFVLNTLEKNDQMNEGLGEFWVQYAYENRIDSNSVTPTSQHIMLYSESGSVDNTFDYNDYCLDDGSIDDAIFVWRGSSYYGLSNFQTQTGQDSNATVCSGLPTDIAPEPLNSASIPVRYTFYPVYPNPFNPTTELKFTLTQTSHIQLKIIDLRGHQSGTLENSKLTAGEHTYHWNAINQEGSAVPSGIYFAVLVINRHREIRKMTLIR